MELHVCAGGRREPHRHLRREQGRERVTQPGADFNWLYGRIVVKVQCSDQQPGAAVEVDGRSHGATQACRRRCVLRVLDGANVDADVVQRHVVRVRVELDAGAEAGI